MSSSTGSTINVGADADTSTTEGIMALVAPHSIKRVNDASNDADAVDILSHLIGFRVSCYYFQISKIGPTVEGAGATQIIWKWGHNGAALDG